jgi:hypothetical protein
MLNRLKSVSKKQITSLLAGVALLSGSILATTGILPVKIGQVETQKNAMAGGWGNWTYRVGSFSPYGDGSGYCKLAIASNYYYYSHSGTTMYCTNGTGLIRSTNMNTACEFKYNMWNEGLWIGDGGYSCYDSYWGYRN